MLMAISKSAAEMNLERVELGRALRRAAEMRGVSQNELADHFGTGQSVVSQWYHGKSALSPWLVFALEEYLNLPAGWLSVHLGYLPVTGQATRPTPEAAVLDDEEFSEKDKAAVLAVIGQIRDYRAAMTQLAPVKRLTAVKATPRKAAVKPAKAAAKRTPAKAAVKKVPAKAAAKKTGGRPRVSAVANNGG